MTTFAVTTESAESKPLRLLVEADNWVAAWHDGLRVIGIAELPADSQCVVGSEGRVDIEVPTLRRKFVLQALSGHQPGPRPSLGRPLLLADTGAGDAAIQVHHATKNPKLFRRPPMQDAQMAAAPKAASEVAPPPLPNVAGSRPGVALPARHNYPAAPDSSGAIVNLAATVTQPPVATSQVRPTPDPIARILSDLERQRLLSRPIRISSQTGLPTQASSVRLRRNDTPSTVPRLAPTTDERRRPREATTAFPAMSMDQLPQQFHPVQADEDDSDPTYEELLQWAAETAWAHVPCELAMVLSLDEGAMAEVVTTRGEREREARGCHVASGSGPTQLGRAPSLMRFSSEHLVRFLRRDATHWELPITSVLSVPIELPDGELAGLGLVLVNASRASGFTDSELRAVTYLARTLAARL